ncbi:MAG: MFS transporter [Deltaproteobacteria bacterium]|jgi:predicted MFS family arabinose efflux permease|nr:MFS transporter [Deltaproteobacteria bacterium]
MPSAPTSITQVPDNPFTNPKPPLWNLTFVTFIVINFCIFFGFDMLLPTLSLYLDARGCSKEEIGLIFASFAASSVVSRLMTTRLSRWLGATRVLRCGLAICLVGSLMFFLIPHRFFYALARILHGAGVGLTSTLMVSMAAQVIPPQRLGEGLGYLGLGATVALAIGPLVGIDLYDDFGYKAMFTSVAGCSLLAGLISLRLPFIRLSSDLAPDPPGLKSFVETRALGPSSLIFIMGASSCAVSAYLAIYCQELGLGNAAVFFVVSTIGTLSARTTTGRIYDRYGPMAVIPPGAVVFSMSVLVLVLFPSKVPMTVAAIFYGLGFGSIFPAVQALTLSSVPSTRRTAASAVFFICFDLGIGLGTLFLGLLAGHFATYRVVYVASPILMVFLILTFFALYGRKKPKPLCPGHGRGGS